MILKSVFVFMLFFYTNVSSQSFVDRHDWRHHPNLKDIKSASIHDNKIYCFAKSGFFFFDLYNNSIVTDGSSLDFISTEFDFSFSNSKYLITGNNSGLIQVISNDENFFLNIDGVSSDFKINSFMVHKEVLYVSSSEGLLSGGAPLVKSSIIFLTSGNSRQPEPSTSSCFITSLATNVSLDWSFNSACSAAFGF